MTISLANRLVGGLASENVRWAEAVEEFKKQETKLPGDVLLVTAFVSYFGYFTKVSLKYQNRIKIFGELFSGGLVFGKLYVASKIKLYL